ncbi:PREDICTED: anoctamin-5-like [Nicrophorus vespilloides]|uniref:Anoctamin n=1 Tax=Nicrophorus vespilloides TaxID=110193 RepID=A0ABM1MNF0_NICVS|nr:PREDICTED: anoctamin-5-like [Nicrophorus vespilloides]
MSSYRKRSILTNPNGLDNLEDKLLACDEKLKVLLESNVEKRDGNYFRDNERTIDYVFVYNLHSKEKFKELVNKYIENLEEAGLEFESENSEQFPHLLFIKVHGPRSVLIRYAYVMSINLSCDNKTEMPPSHRNFNFNFLFTELTRPDESTNFYKRNTESISGQRPSDITSAERIMVIHQILSKAKYGDQEHEFGLETLLKNKYLQDAYALHDGTYKWTTSGPLNDRQLLSKYWANFGMCFKLQPLELIQKYYGPEVGFYFSFLGFYNRMLITAMIFGLATSIYGIHTYDTEKNVVSHEISTFCYEIWKREQAILIYKWNLLYLEHDPTMRLAVRYALAGYTKNEFIRSYASMVATLTANSISLTILILFEYLYTFLARKLTDYENPRTQSEYDKSFTYKQYILSFVNGYSVIYYTSFFKGTYFTYPGDREQYDNLGVLNSDVCAPFGCILEVSMQLAIILLGKNLFKSSLEVIIPIMPVWEINYLDVRVDYYFLYRDYKDIILQYGYIILFSAVFPLAPLLAIIYNTLEIRIDAYKLTRVYRRPLPVRTEGIAAWNVILQVLTVIGIATNAFLVAFTTQFVPYLLRVYGDATSFISYTFSEFAVDDYRGVTKGNMSGNICYYKGKRHPPNHAEKYKPTTTYWYEYASRTLTVIIIEVLVMCFTSLIAFAIPDVPRSIRERIANQERLDMELREKNMTRNIKNKDRNSRAISISSDIRLRK